MIFIRFKAQDVVDLASDSSYVKFFLCAKKCYGLRYGRVKFDVTNGFKVLHMTYPVVVVVTLVIIVS